MKIFEIYIYMRKHDTPMLQPPQVHGQWEGNSLNEWILKMDNVLIMTTL